MKLLSMALLFAAAGLHLSCNPCGGPCDGTVHPMPIQSGGPFLDEEPPDCLADGGFDGRCVGQVAIDATAGIVTHQFVVGGHQHVVRYRVKAVSTIAKGPGN